MDLFYTFIRWLARAVFYVFYRNHSALHAENFPKDDGVPVLFIAAPHGNFLMDAITLLVTCPRRVFFISSTSNFNYPVFGQIISGIGAIPVMRPQDVERVNGVGTVKVFEDGRTVAGKNLGKTVQVGDRLYVEFEGPSDNVLREACGCVEEIISDNRVRVKEPGMKWLTKGRPKGAMRRLVEYGSLVIRVERGSTIKTLEGLSIIPKSVTRGLERLSTSPGRLTYPIVDENEEPNEIVIHESPFSGASERSPLLAESSRPRSLRRSSSTSINRVMKPSIQRIPSIPTTWSYSHMPTNSDVFSAVYDKFSHGQCILIFPEGVSHDNEHMLSLKYGCAVMALGYLASREPDAAGKARRLRLVPCGLNFFNRHRFRSRVFVNVGLEIEIPERVVEMYRENGDAKRQACQELLNRIHSSLLEITVNAPDYDTLLFYKTSSRLYRETLPSRLSFPDKLHLLSRIKKKYTSTTPPTAQVRRLKDDVVSYAQALRVNRISPPHITYSPRSVLLTLPLLVILTVAAIPGLILFSPIGLAARYVGKKQGENAMLYDDDSLAITRWPGRDVIATWKMVVGIFLFIVFDVIYSSLAIHFARAFGILGLYSTVEAVAAWVGMFSVFCPVVAYVTILLWERMCWVGKAVWVGVWGLAHPNQRRRLLLWKRELSTRIARWVETPDPSPRVGPTSTAIRAISVGSSVPMTVSPTTITTHLPSSPLLTPPTLPMPVKSSTPIAASLYASSYQGTSPRPISIYANSGGSRPINIYTGGRPAMGDFTPSSGGISVH